MTSNRPTLVLVPGAWHLPSTFDLLRGELDSLGYATRAVKLLTSGPAARGGLHDDAAAVREAVEALSGPAVVVAHSYGGIPATEAVPDDVQRLVYLAAFVPDVGESMYTLVGAREPELADGLFPTSDDPLAQFYADMPEADGLQAVSKLVDQLHRPFAERVTRAAWRNVPSAYIVAEHDNALPVELQEQMATRTKETHRISSGHSPFLSRPAELAALLDRIVQG